mmetsp:Transcript_140125/g.435810  ORF Transcript_140125/g.435810 Transcript_140125/m.435810 type:complete len:246 (+) Transcript_140125:609-1346(+)
MSQGAGQDGEGGDPAAVGHGRRPGRRAGGAGLQEAQPPHAGRRLGGPRLFPGAAPGRTDVGRREGGEGLGRGGEGHEEAVQEGGVAGRVVLLRGRRRCSQGQPRGPWRCGEGALCGAGGGARLALPRLVAAGHELHAALHLRPRERPGAACHVSAGRAAGDARVGARHQGHRALSGASRGGLGAGRGGGTPGRRARGLALRRRLPAQHGAARDGGPAEDHAHRRHRDVLRIRRGRPAHGRGHACG